MDAARVRKGLQSRRHVYGIAEDVTTLSNDSAKIDANSNRYPPLRCERLIPLDNRAANGCSGARRFHDISKFAEGQIAGFLENAPAMFTNERLENLSEYRSEVKHALEFVAGKQPPVTDYQ